MTYRQLIDKLGRMPNHLLDDDVTIVIGDEDLGYEAFAANLRQMEEDTDLGLDDDHLFIAVIGDSIGKVI